MESVAAAHDGLHGESNLHAVQLLCALCAQLSACPELADCSDLGAFIVKKYAPAAERAGELVTLKNKRFAELARVVALAPRALYAEFDLDAEAEGESGGEHCASLRLINVQPLSARMSVAAGRPVPPLDKVRAPPAPCTLLSSQCARMFSCRLIIVAAAL